jgi:uncharacterized cupin superfamily protein
VSDFRHPHVVNVDEVEPTSLSHGERFFLLRKQLGAAAGGKKLGCTLVELPPGKRAWPFHYHAANEEAIYVVEGNGRLRLAASEIILRPGDYVVLLPGPDWPHQTMNDSDRPLRYLCFSTMIEPEVNFYPDSRKFGFFAGAAPGGDLDDNAQISSDLLLE